MDDLIPVEKIESKIYLIRGEKVILDADLALLYGVKTKYLNKQVRRNIERFPGDFMFQLTEEEFLRFHFGTSKRGGRRYLPLVFTEQGVAMLSSVLRSRRAIRANIVIMRAFIMLRQMLAAHKELAQMLAELERKYEKHDEEIKSIFDAIRQLMAPPEKPIKKIGFITD